jgi:hypothetical protein
MHQQTTSLPTPEATPGPDSDQFKADKARQQAAEPLSQSKPSFNPPESRPSSPADSHMRGNESGEQTGSSSSSSPSSQSNGLKEPKATYTKEQKKVVDDVLNFGSQEYHKILVLEPKKIEKAFKKRPHPDKNTYSEAEEAEFLDVPKGARILSPRSYAS